MQSLLSSLQYIFSFKSRFTGYHNETKFMIKIRIAFPDSFFYVEMKLNEDTVVEIWSRQYSFAYYIGRFFMLQSQFSQVHEVPQCS